LASTSEQARGGPAIEVMAKATRRRRTRWQKRAERAEALIELQKTSGGVAGNAADRRALVIATVAHIGPQLGIAPTCAALGLPRATYYRRRCPGTCPHSVPCRAP